MPPLGSLILEIKGRTRSSLRHALYAPLGILPAYPSVLYQLYRALTWKVEHHHPNYPALLTIVFSHTNELILYGGP